MAKIKKQDEKQLRAIAKLLPKQYNEFSGKHSIVLTGEEIINSGVKTAVNIDAKKLYSKTKTVKTLRSVNHYLRMKRLFLKHGVMAVNSYVN